MGNNYIWIVMYVLVMILISIYFTKKSVKSYGEYAVANHSLSFFFTFFTFFSTWISGATILGLATMAFKWGVSQYWFIAITYLVGAISGPLFLTRIKSLQVYTIGDFFALRYRKWAKSIKLLFGISMICRNITIIGAQFTTVAFILSIGFSIDFEKALFATAAFIIFYTALSGFWGVAGTDIIQGLVQIIGLPVLIFAIIQKSGGITNILNFYQQINGEGFLDLFHTTAPSSHLLFLFLAPGLFFIIEDQTSWQRIQSAKNTKVAFWGYLSPIGAALLWTLVPAFLGVFSKTIFPNFTAFPVALMNFIFLLPQPAMLAILLAILSAAISTADSYLLASGVIVSRDFFHSKNTDIQPVGTTQKIHFQTNPTAQLREEREKIWITRIGIIVTGLLSLYCCYQIYDIFELYMLGAYIGGSTITVPYLLTWFSRHMNGPGIISGILAGGGGFAFFFLILHATYPASMLLAMLCNLTAACLICLITKKPEQDEVDATYYFSPRFRLIKNIPK